MSTGANGVTTTATRAIRSSSSVWQECRRFGVEVDEAEYFAGWKDGYDEWYRLIGSMDGMSNMRR